jgi:hypothetical protein
MAAGLPSPIAMVDQPSRDLALGYRHLQSLKRQLPIDAPRQAPANTFARVDIQQTGQAHKAFR